MNNLVTLDISWMVLRKDEDISHYAGIVVSWSKYELVVLKGTKEGIVDLMKGYYGCEIWCKEAWKWLLVVRQRELEAIIVEYGAFV